MLMWLYLLIFCIEDINLHRIHWIKVKSATINKLHNLNKNLGKNKTTDTFYNSKILNFIKENNIQKVRNWIEKRQDLNLVNWTIQYTRFPHKQINKPEITSIPPPSNPYLQAPDNVWPFPHCRRLHKPPPSCL